MITGGYIGLSFLLGRTTSTDIEPSLRPLVSWPRIDGIARSGETLTVVAPALTNVQSYQWYLEEEAVPGATTASYVAPMMGNVSCHVVADQGEFVTPIAQVNHSHVMDVLEHVMMEDAVLALARHSSASHIAVQNGLWSDPLTWDVGRVPDEGAVVLVPIGVSVTYDVASSPRLDRLRLDGALRAALDQSSQMHVETIIISHSGLLEIGAGFESRLPGQFNFEVLISDRAYSLSPNAPSDLDLANDPFLMGRGIVCLGNFVVFGDERKRHIKTADGAAPRAWDRFITLAQEPVDWRVGDEIVIPGTAVEVIDDATTIFDERRTITDISGSVVSFAERLYYEHDHHNAAVLRTDLQPSIANVSTNVTVRSETDTTPHRRGHIMVMHDGFSDVWDVGIVGLGRTDTTKGTGNILPGGLFENYDLGTEQVETVSVTSASNIKGRYPFHFHFCGFQRSEVPNIHNSVIDGSPGWGLVHHGCEAEIFDNNVFNWSGAGIVSETGNEIGPWVRNFSFGCRNTVNASHSAIKTSEVKRGGLKGNFATFGIGMYFRSRAVRTVDNVAASCPMAYGFYHRGDADSISPGIEILREHTDTKDIASFNYNRIDTIPFSTHTISHFTRNEAFGCITGFSVTKAAAKQGFDIMTQLKDFRAWGAYRAMHLEYVSNYIMINIDAVGTAYPSQSGYGHAGANFAGMKIGQNTARMVVKGGTIDGFRKGVSLVGYTNDSVGLRNDIFSLPDNPRHVVDSPTILNFVTEIDIDESGTAEGDATTASVVRIVTPADDLQIKAEPDINIPFIIYDWDGSTGFGPNVSITNEVFSTATKTDTYGTRPLVNTFESLQMEIGTTSNWTLRDYGARHGYWTYGGENIVVFWQYYSDMATARIIIKPHAIRCTGTIDGSWVNNGEWTDGTGLPYAADIYVDAPASTTTTVDVLAEVFDPDTGASLSLASSPWGSSYFAPGSGSVVVDAVSGTVAFTPDRDFDGQDEMYVWVTDGMHYTTVKIHFNAPAKTIPVLVSFGQSNTNLGNIAAIMDANGDTYARLDLHIGATGVAADDAPWNIEIDDSEPEIGSAFVAFVEGVKNHLANNPTHYIAAAVASQGENDSAGLGGWNNNGFFDANVTLISAIRAVCGSDIPVFHYTRSMTFQQGGHATGRQEVYDQQIAMDEGQVGGISDVHTIITDDVFAAAGYSYPADEAAIMDDTIHYSQLGQNLRAQAVYDLAEFKAAMGIT